jgi:hypothetical protein
LEAYREICLKKGATLQVGPAHYRWFVELSDNEMREMIRLMLLDRTADIHRWINADPQMKSEQDIFDYIELMLRMIAKGYAAIQQNGSLGCFAPCGPEPSEANWTTSTTKFSPAARYFETLYFAL